MRAPLFRFFASMLTCISLALSFAGSAAAEPDDGHLHFRKGTLTSAPSGCDVTASHGGAQACWKSYGDKLYVKDTMADGKRAGSYFSIEVPFGGDGICYNTGGSGTWAVCDFDFSENRPILIEAGSCDADFSHKCAVLNAWWTADTKYSST